MMDNQSSFGITFERREDLEEFIGLIKDVKDIKTILTDNNIPKMRTTLSFLEKFFWILAAGSLTAVIAAFFALLTRK